MPARPPAASARTAPSSRSAREAPRLRRRVGCRPRLRRRPPRRQERRRRACCAATAASSSAPLRAAPAGRLDPAARTRFLAALSACANVRLAAKAAGFSHAALYHHKRRDPAFAREWRHALETGYARLEAALLAGWSPDGAAPDDWLRNDPPPIPPMSPAQAMQLMYLHQKEARLWVTPTPLRCRPGEPVEVRDMRLLLMHEARLQRDREQCERAEAARLAERDGPPGPHDPAPPALPDLAQVTGWSKASGKPAHDKSRVLFGVAAR